MSAPVSRTITVEELGRHSKKADAWIAINERCVIFACLTVFDSNILFLELRFLNTRVYDISNYLRSHPGGEDVLLSCLGRDATKDFDSIGHSSL